MRINAMASTIEKVEPDTVMKCKESSAPAKIAVNLKGLWKT
jgi:hypothetical protein